MANIDGIITEDIRTTIAHGQKVYDCEGRQVGTVDAVDQETGYFIVHARHSLQTKDNPFEDKYLYVPFRVITTIDPRELYVSVSGDELRRDYAAPPPRVTQVQGEGEDEVATTTEPSGYDGTPIVVRRARINDLKTSIAVGDYVLSSDMRELGVIKDYDPATGWMVVTRDVISKEPGLRVPVEIVDTVDRQTNQVYLILSEADLERREHVHQTSMISSEIDTQVER